MLFLDQADKILRHVLNTPEVVLKFQDALNIGDTQAAIGALQTDKMFRVYFSAVAKKGGFCASEYPQNLSDFIKSAGEDIFRAVVISYAFFLKSPKSWKIFNIDAMKLVEFNARILADWVKILTHIRKKNAKNLALASSASLIFIVCELAFADRENLEQIIKISDLSYDKILRNSWGKGLLKIACEAVDWDFNKVSVINRRVIYYFELLLIYELQKPEFRAFKFSEVMALQSGASYEMVLDFNRAMR